MDTKIPKGHTMHPEMTKIIRWQFDEWLKNKKSKDNCAGKLEKIDENLSVLEIDNIEIQTTKSSNKAGYFTLN